MMPQQDPFVSVRLSNRNTSSIDSEPPKISTQESENDPFSQVRKNKTEGFPFIYEGGRHIARAASRIGEVIGGIPGDISSLIQSGVFSGLENLVGQKVSSEVKEKAKSQRLPTSKELKEFSESSTNGFTKPQSNTEKTIDEYIETAASLLGPLKFRKALGVSLGAVGAKKTAEIGGLKELPQEAAKLGTMFVLTMMNPKGALNYAASQFERANQLARGASISAVPFEGHLVNLVNELRMGVTTPAKNAVMKPAEELVSKVKNGKIAVRDLTAAKRDINTLMKDPDLLKRERKLLKNVGQEVDKAIKPFERMNPAFSKAYRPANEIYSAVMQGTKASDFIHRTLGAKSVLGAVLGEAALGHPELILPTFAGAAAVMGTAKTLDFFTRLMKSPELRKYYNKAMIAAAAEDASSLRLYENKIEKELEKNQSSKSRISRSIQ